MKIAYCRDSAEHASSVLRYLLPAQFMDDNGVAETYMVGKVVFDKNGEIETPEVRDSDIIVMGQVIFPRDLEIAKMLKKKGKKLVIDADDLYFENGYKIFDKETIESCKEIARIADLVTVCSPFLGKMYEQVGVKPEKIKYIPNYTIVSDWNYWWEKRALKRLEKKNYYKDKVLIGFMGSNQHCRDWEWLFPVMEKVVKKYGEKIQLEFVGMPLDPTGFVLGNKSSSQSVLESAVKAHNLYKGIGAKFLEGTFKFEEFYPMMCKLGWDIGLAPLSNDRTTKSKSYLKYLDYGMARMAGIYQGISPFTDVIKHGVTGVMANTKKDWFDYICDLVEDDEHREFIVQNALEDIKNNHDISDNWVSWYNEYKKIA